MGDGGGGLRETEKIHIQEEKIKEKQSCCMKENGVCKVIQLELVLEYVLLLWLVLMLMLLPVLLLLLLAVDAGDAVAEVLGEKVL